MFLFIGFREGLEETQRERPAVMEEVAGLGTTADG